MRQSVATLYIFMYLQYSRLTLTPGPVSTSHLEWIVYNEHQDINLRHLVPDKNLQLRLLEIITNPIAS